MKAIAIALITFYQKTISYWIKGLVGVSSACRYSPTCSEYTKQSILKKGIIIGSYISFLRVFSCRRFLM